MKSNLTEKVSQITHLVSVAAERDKVFAQALSLPCHLSSIVRLVLILNCCFEERLESHLVTQGSQAPPSGVRAIKHTCSPIVRILVFERCLRKCQNCDLLALSITNYRPNRIFRLVNC